MSVRRRAGRKAAETHKKFLRDVGNFAAAFAGAEWQYSNADTDKMTIKRVAKETGSKESIPFSRAYAQLSRWDRKSFANISDLGFSDFLADTFLHGAAIHTGDAVYRLAN